MHVSEHMFIHNNYIIIIIIIVVADVIQCIIIQIQSIDCSTVQS